MSRQRAKGTAWESEIVRFLRANGWPHAERRALGGSNDRGDIAGVIGVTIEAKNVAAFSPAWVDEAERERKADGAWLGVVWHKRRGKTSAADGMVTMTGDAFLNLLAEVEGIRRGAAP